MLPAFRSTFASRPTKRLLRWALAALLLVGLASPLAVAQPRGRQAMQTEAQQAGEEVEDMARILLTEYLIGGEQLTEEDMVAIEEALNTLGRYRGAFEPPHRASFLLVQALLAQFRGQQDQAFNLLRQARSQDLTNGNVNETIITLALLYERYELAREALAERQGGAAAEIMFEQPTAEQLAQAAAGMMPRDPNVARQAAGPADPNTGAAAAEAEPEEPRSRFSRFGSSEPQQPPQGPQPGPPGMPHDMPHGGPPEMMPGMGFGPMAPGPPDMMPGYEQGRPRDPRMPGGPRRAEVEEDGYSASALNLPVAHMPYEYLGESIESLQLLSTNGAYFNYQADSGQMLVMLLWALPDDGQVPASRSARGRTTRSQAAQMPSGLMAPPEWGGMPMAPNAGAAAESLNFEVETELAPTLEQFRELFKANLSLPVAQMAAVNLDPVTRRPQYLAALLEHNWPWTNCNVNEGFNPQQWPFTKSYSPIMVLAGVDGVIRYMGPVGGFLPRKIVEQEAPKVVAAQMGAMPEKLPAAGGGLGAMMQMLGQMAGQGRSPAPAADEAPAPTTETAPAEAAAEAAPPVEQLASNEQAARMLEAARVQRAISPRRACQMADEVIERYPDTVEAEQARLMIETILRRDRRLRDERAAQGLYTGP